MHKTVGAVLLAALAAGCAGAQEGKPAVTVGPFAAEQAAGCPAGEFEGFFARFSEDIAVQRQFVRDPLEVVLISPDDANEEGRRSLVPKGEVTFPVFLGQAERTRHGVSYLIEQDASAATVSTQSQGTGAYTMRFDFVRQDGCWYLTRTSDYST